MARYQPYWRQQQQVCVIRIALLSEHGAICAYCGCNFTNSTQKLTIDHIRPRAEHGPLVLQNCVLACRQCNRRKGRQDVREFVGEHFPNAPITRWRPELFEKKPDE